MFVILRVLSSERNGWVFLSFRALLDKVHAGECSETNVFDSSAFVQRASLLAMFAITFISVGTALQLVWMGIDPLLFITRT